MRLTSKTAAVAVAGFLVTTVVAAWIGDLLHDSPMALMPPVVLTFAVILILPGGPFAKDGRKASLLNRIAAYILLAAYLAVAIIGSRSWSIPILLSASACLAAAACLLLWPVLASSASFGELSLLVTLLLLGVALLLGGIRLVGEGRAIVGIAALLFGLGILLSGVGSVGDGQSIFGASFLLLGVASLMGGIGFIADGWAITGVAALLGAVAFVLFGIVFLGDRQTLAGISLLLLGASTLLFGIGFLISGRTMAGVGSMVLGVACLLGVIAFYSSRQPLALMLPLGGAGLIPFGASFLSRGQPLAGVASILCGATSLLFGIALLVGGSSFRGRIAKVWANMTRRDPLLPEAAEKMPANEEAPIVPTDVVVEEIRLPTQHP